MDGVPNAVVGLCNLKSLFTLESPTPTPPGQYVYPRPSLPRPLSPEQLVGQWNPSCYMEMSPVLAKWSRTR